jgi:hypothetical protein
LLEKKR